MKLNRAFLNSALLVLAITSTPLASTAVAASTQAKPPTSASSSAKAAGAPIATTENPLVLQEYLRIQEALAKDSFDGVKETAASIAKNANHNDIKGAADKVAAAKDINEARESFKGLSAAVIPLVNKKKGDVEVVSCPMAKAKWVQKTGEISNPYYGKDMLTCGEKVK